MERVVRTSRCAHTKHHDVNAFLIQEKGEPNSARL